MNRGTLLERVDRSLGRLGLRGTGLTVAVSGGPDSVALLTALLRLGVQPLLIAHLNHQLRGAESDADEAFVRQVHTSFLEQGHSHLWLRCGTLDIARIADAAGENLEAAARSERYRWLAEMARLEGLNHVATGHTADDQAETVLHRLLRGTGLQGLRGIAERRPLSEGVELVRPMLDVTRAEVLAFLQAEGISACQDSSNADLKYTRNRIRHELLPYLAEHFNPSVCEVLGRLARDASEAFEDEQADILALLAEAELPRAGGHVILGREILQRATGRRVRQLFRYVWERENWSASGMSFDHWHRLEAIVFGELTAADFPGGIHVRRRERVIQAGPRTFA